MNPTELKDGVLVWADRSPESFKRPKDYVMWRKRFLGQPVQVQTARKAIREQTGAKLIYSTDRQYKNVAPANLSTKFKRPRNHNNTSGTTGVYLCHSSGLWKASIYEDGKRRHLGSFHDKQDAIDARKQAERRLNYPEGYGTE